MNYTKKQKGFSIMEGMISAFVLTVGLLAVLQLFSSSLKASYDTRDRIIASGLAQEGVELVRNIRDNNVLAGNDAFQGINAGENRRVDVVDGWSNGGQKDLYYDNSVTRSQYVHDNSYDETGFHRRIKAGIDNNTTPSDRSDDILTVKSEVIWGGDAFPASESDCNIKEKCIIVTSILSAR